MSIDFIPDIEKYPHIFGAHQNKKLVIFIGAGLSALWGCKRWKDMSAFLIDKCYQENKIDYWDLDVLKRKHASSPRKLITIAKSLLDKDEYLAALNETLTPLDERKKKHPELFNDLFALNAAYITTNIDCHFSSLFEGQNVFVSPAQFAIGGSKIIHLHGSINSPDSLVLTIEEYVSRYQDDGFRLFLETIFFKGEYCFLFIGYGVDEMEIIDFMIEKYSKGHRVLHGLNRFYALLPFFQNEEKLLGYEQLYFDQIKMSVIPYAIDSKGYDQLSQVIEEWKKKLVTPSAADKFYKYAGIIDNHL